MRKASDYPPHYQEQIRKQLGTGPKLCSRVGVHGKKLTGIEQTVGCILGQLKDAGIIRTFSFEPQKYRFTNDCTYTYDWGARLNCNTDAYIECKGPPKAQGNKEDGRIKFKWFSREHPGQPRLWIQQQDGGGYKVELRDGGDVVSVERNLNINDVMEHMAEIIKRTWV